MFVVARGLEVLWFSTFLDLIRWFFWGWGYFFSAVPFFKAPVSHLFINSLYDFVWADGLLPYDKRHNGVRLLTRNNRRSQIRVFNRGIKNHFCFCLLLVFSMVEFIITEKWFFMPISDALLQTSSKNRTATFKKNKSAGLFQP